MPSFDNHAVVQIATIGKADYNEISPIVGNWLDKITLQIQTACTLLSLLRQITLRLVPV